MPEASNSSRWPWVFDLDDVTVVSIIRAGLSTEEVRSDRVPGVRVTHRPTGIAVVADSLMNREDNLRIAFQRLDQRIKRSQRA